MPCVPRDLTNAEAWRNRKGQLTQNILAGCSFDMKFICFYPGWEGSAHDMRVLQDAINSGQFPMPPSGLEQLRTVAYVYNVLIIKRLYIDA